MADTELTQTEPKVTTVSVTCSDTILDPGNELRDPVFLEQLQDAEPLSATDLAKVAKFLQAYPTNKCLADHLAEFALILIATDPRLQPAIQQFYPMDFDWWEDFWDGASDEPNAKPPTALGTSHKKNPNAIFALPLLPGLVLLVESRSDGEEISYFLIGATCNPANLPL